MLRALELTSETQTEASKKLLGVLSGTFNRGYREEPHKEELDYYFSESFTLSQSNVITSSPSYTVDP